MALISAFYIWSVLDSDIQQAEEPTAAALGVPDLRGVDAYRAFVASPGVSAIMPTSSRKCPRDG